MRHKGERNNHLDSTRMSFSPSHRFLRRGLAALVAAFCLPLLLAGCTEDRSNLIPDETAESLISKLDRVDQLAAEGRCFDATEVAASAQEEVENLGPDVDPELKRSLLDGVTQLQVFVSDPEKCTESEATDTEEPEVIEEVPIDPEGTTGDTGTTDTGESTTGEQGTTDENQTPEDRQGNGNQNPTPTPPTTPEPADPTTPANPTPPTPPEGPGSGGLGPG